VQGDIAIVLQMINECGMPVLAIDVPSGMDCDTGEPLGVCVRATKTVTFVAEKAGFANPDSKQYTGEVIVGDIGCPRELIEEVTRAMP
jgi:NAD(P)H-hydrate epimerase